MKKEKIALMLSGLILCIAAAYWFYGVKLALDTRDFYATMLDNPQLKMRTPVIEAMNANCLAAIRDAYYGFWFLGAGSALILLAFIGINKKAVSASIIRGLLMISMTISIPAVSAQTSGDRWYARLKLDQPKDSNAIQGNVYLYDNYVKPSSEDSFSCFAFWMSRWYNGGTFVQFEWIEGGYFENSSGFWIYGAYANLYDGYVLQEFAQVRGNGASGTNYFTFTIMQSVSNTKYQVWMDPHELGALMFPIEPGGGSYLIIEMTFNIQGNNEYQAGGESTNPDNTLNGHYDALNYYSGGWNPWTQVTQDVYSPYRLTMVNSNAFFTHGGYGIRTMPSAHRGGYITYKDGDI